MAAEGNHAPSEILRGLSRHLNCLNEDNKTARQRTLETIKRETIDKNLSSDVLQEIFSVLLKPLLKCLSDPMDRCRETTIATITEFIRCVPNPEQSLPYLMPCLAQRFGDKEILEPSEELRLLALEMLSLTLEVCGKHFAPYLNEMMNILQRAIVDPFPDVKRESCKCVLKFANSVPGWWKRFVFSRVCCHGTEAQFYFLYSIYPMCSFCVYNVLSFSKNSIICFAQYFTDCPNKKD